MSVTLQTPYNKFSGNGVTTVFPYQFLLLAATDLAVYVGGVLKTNGADYSVSNVGVTAGGNVTFVTAPASSTIVALVRAMRRERLTDYQQLGDFLTAVVNPDFDRAILLAQDINTGLSRAIQAPSYEPDALMVLPAAATRASQIVSMDPAGNVLMLAPSAVAGVSVAGTAIVDKFTATANQTVFTLSGNPGSINNILVAIDGAVLVAGDDFTWGAGGLTLMTGALVGQRVQVAYTGSIALTSVSPGSVGDSALVAGSNVQIASKAAVAEVTVTSAGTVDLGAQTSLDVLITGTVTITSFGSTPTVSGVYYQVRFSGSLVLTYNVTSLILPGAANITTLAGDSLTAKYEGAGNWRVTEYNRAIDIPTSSTGDTIRRGIAICKYKTVTTARASTTALTNDSELFYAIPVAGTYAIEVFVPVTGGAGGVSFNLNYSAGITTSLALIELIANAAPVVDKSIAISAAVATSLQSAAAVTALDVIRMSATLVAAAPGTLGVAWAQNSSNAAATNFGQGAFLKVTQLS